MTGTENFTLDTNILFYSIDAADERKHTIAARVVSSLLERKPLLALQVLNELSRTVLRRKAMAVTDLQRLVQQYSESFLVVPPASTDLLDALTAVNQHRMQFWDAVLWATARRVGCNVLLTEDGQSGQTIQGVTLLNPFLEPVDQRISMLLL